MTMRPSNVPPDATVAIDVPLEIYLKGRDEAVNINVTYEIPTAVLSEGDELQGVMQIGLSNILSTIDIVREHRLIFSDSRFNKFVFLTDEVQAIALLAPDADTVRKALEAT